MRRGLRLSGLMHAAVCAWNLRGLSLQGPGNLGSRTSGSGLKVNNGLGGTGRRSTRIRVEKAACDFSNFNQMSMVDLRAAAVMVSKQAFRSCPEPL